MDGSRPGDSAKHDSQKTVESSDSRASFENEPMIQCTNARARDMSLRCSVSFHTGGGTYYTSIYLTIETGVEMTGAQSVPGC